MIIVVALVGMPVALMAVTLAADAMLKAHPSKDDLWRLPKVSSLRA
ncbi:hypothetical protein BHAOGJBA_3701 [Methylobacterium hispanicum]|uniref:Uncharacterized protein n=1 Tax=Methylobacterium hispanicum TaxID=270350 RepID=A0AAV4ZPW4_9HYPH|nr:MULTISPECIES: hypothetical protein [Methylobacterium]GJD90166.1 hypothetical protein BHAOGJBA_3701 [Methylobacterium hispanicum]